MVSDILLTDGRCYHITLHRYCNGVTVTATLEPIALFRAAIHERSVTYIGLISSWKDNVRFLYANIYRTLIHGQIIEIFTPALAMIYCLQLTA